MARSEFAPDVLTAQPANARPAGNDEDWQEVAQAMRLALKRAVDYAMRHPDAVQAANEAMRLLRSEFLWRFELLRSRQRQPVLIVPEPLLPLATVCQPPD